MAETKDADADKGRRTGASLRLRLAALFFLVVLPLTGERIFVLLQAREQMVAQKLGELREFSEQVALVQLEHCLQALVWDLMSL